MNNSKIIVDIGELKRRVGLPLDEKIKWAIERYIDFVEVYCKEGVYIGFSGGKDSHTLSDIIDALHSGEYGHYLEGEYLYLYQRYIKNKPPPPKVFCDTGLEFPEIRKHVKKFANVTWLKPKTLWTEVVEKSGFLIGSKKISRMIRDIRNPTDKNKNSRTLYLTGIKKDGSKSKSFLLPQMWRKLINAPFNISGDCCTIFKKEPFHRYEKLTGRKPISATTTEESQMRRISYMMTGCNSFGDKAMSRPMSIFTEDNVWEYARLRNLRFADVYYDREVDYIEDDGLITKRTVVGEKRTGCMFCMIGSPKQIKTRFDRLSVTHQKQFNFLFTTINIKRVFEFLGIKKSSNKKEPIQQKLF